METSSVGKVWVVAYIDKAFMDSVDKDLARLPEYNGVEAYIPTVKILKKTFKGQETFDEVPLLFNYGFFNIPRERATSRAFLENMRTNIGCIFSWIPDKGKKVLIKPEGSSGDAFRTDLYIPAAIATPAEIQRLVELAKDSAIFSAVEIDRVKVGDVITLKGYPWEDMEARVIEINEKKRKLKVSILLFQQQKDITVNFDSVFFTTYTEANHNPDVLSKYSLDDLQDKKVLDKLTKKLNY